MPSETIEDVPRREEAPESAVKTARTDMVSDAVPEHDRELMAVHRHPKIVQTT